MPSSVPGTILAQLKNQFKRNFYEFFYIVIISHMSLSIMVEKPVDVQHIHRQICCVLIFPILLHTKAARIQFFASSNLYERLSFIRNPSSKRKKKKERKKKERKRKDRKGNNAVLQSAEKANTFLIDFEKCEY